MNGDSGNASQDEHDEDQEHYLEKIQRLKQTENQVTINCILKELLHIHHQYLFRKLKRQSFVQPRNPISLKNGNK